MDSDFFGTSTDTPGGPNHEKPAKASGSQQKTRPKPRNSYPQGAATTHPASQDLTIAVRERKDVDGFGPWTMKSRNRARATSGGGHAGHSGHQASSRRERTR